MTALSQSNRDACAKAMLHNLHTVPARFRRCPAYVTGIEMVAVASLAYDPANLHYKGDTLDRHSWQPYGNHNELLAIFTICHNDGSFNLVHICRTKKEQKDEKIDFMIGNIKYQVKTIDRGSFDDFFISQSDREGEAHFLVYVDNAARLVYVINNLALDQVASRKYTRDKNEDVFPSEDHKHAGTIKQQEGSTEGDWRGHYVNDVMVRQMGGEILSIPPHLTTMTIEA